MCILCSICCRYPRKANSEHVESANARQTQPQRTSPIIVPPRLPAPLHARVPPTPVHVSHNDSSAFVENLDAEQIGGSYQEYFNDIYHEEYIPKVSPVPQQKHPKLDDYGNSEDLKQLTVKQLKILLTINRVNFKGCIEKSELLEKVFRLWEDNNQHKNISEKNTPTEQLCKLCMDAPLDCVFLECGHIASCIECGKKLAECPICRQYVVRVVRTFKA